MARSSAWIFVNLVSFGLGMVELSNRGGRSIMHAQERGSRGCG